MNESRRETSPYGKNIENLLRYFWESEIRLKKKHFFKFFKFVNFWSRNDYYVFFPHFRSSWKEPKVCYEELLLQCFSAAYETDVDISDIGKNSSSSEDNPNYAEEHDPLTIPVTKNRFKTMNILRVLLIFNPVSLLSVSAILELSVRISE